MLERLHLILMFSTWWLLFLSRLPFHRDVAVQHEGGFDIEISPWIHQRTVNSYVGKQTAMVWRMLIKLHSRWMDGECWTLIEPTWSWKVGNGNLLWLLYCSYSQAHWPTEFVGIKGPIEQVKHVQVTWTVMIAGYLSSFTEIPIVKSSTSYPVRLLLWM